MMHWPPLLSRGILCQTFSKTLFCESNRKVGTSYFFSRSPFSSEKHELERAIRGGLVIPNPLLFFFLVFSFFGYVYLPYPKVIPPFYLKLGYKP